MLRVLKNYRYLAPAILLLGLVLLGTARPALAAGVVGNGTPGSCTETAFFNKLSGGGTVTFNCGPAPKTIVIAAIKQIMANTTVDGGNKITLQASGTDHFQVFVGNTFNLKNIILTDGNSSSAGAIENFGTTVLTNVTFSNNTASGGNGGAIYNNGTLKVKKSTFNHNQADNGGAIFIDGGTVTISASTFSGNKAIGVANQGGAIENSNGILTLKNSTLSGNTGAEGAGLFTDFGTTNTIKSTTFSKNKSPDTGGAINNRGTTTISGSTITGNKAVEGGGIAQLGSLTLVTSTVSNNKATIGAGMADFGNSTHVTQSTFSGNVAKQDGGGIWSDTNTVLTNSTLSGNKANTTSGSGGAYFQSDGGSDWEFVTVANNAASNGGGIYVDGLKTGSAQMEDVVLATNTGGNCDGTPEVSLGGNLSDDTFCSGFTQSSDKNNKNAKLGPLANNGGPTSTQKPQAGSPAINKGVAIPGITVDQRGFVRPLGGKPDIGAVEAQ